MNQLSEVLPIMTVLLFPPSESCNKGQWLWIKSFL